MDDILNFVQLTERVGTSGQPTEAQFRRIADAGYAAVINLAMPDSDNAIPDEGRLVTQTGMSYLHIPVKWDAPTVGDLQTFIRAMQAFDEQRVWVHCAMNLRVSAFMYHYLKTAEGLDESSARSPILSKWEPRMDDVWRDFLALPPERVTADSTDQTR